MTTEEWTPTRSRVEAARQERGRLDYFFFFNFFYCNYMDNRDELYFNKILLSSVPVLFTL